MAITVPRYTDQNGLPATPNAMPTARQTAAPSAAQLGAYAQLPTNSLAAGLKEADRGFNVLAAHFRAQEDADMTLQAKTVLLDQHREKDADWSNRAGANARGLTKEANEWWAGAGAKAGENLNPRQRRAFDGYVAQLRDVSMGKVSQHEAVENRNSLDQSAQSTVVASVNLAAANPTDQSAQALAQSQILEATAARAALNGWDKNRVAVELAAKNTLLHKEVLTALTDSDPDAAAAYYKAHEKDIDGSARAAIKKTIETGSRLAKVQEFADQYDPKTSPDGEAAALAEARKQFSGEDERLAVAEIRSRYIEHSAARKRAEDEAAGEASNILAETGSITRIPPSLLARMNGKDRMTMINTLEARNANREARQANRESREWTREQRAITVTEAQGNGNYWAISQGIVEGQVNRDMIRVAATARDKADAVSPAQAQRLEIQLANNEIKIEAVHIPTLKAVLAPIIKQEKWHGVSGNAKAGHLQTVAEGEILAEQHRLKRPLGQEEMRNFVNNLMIQGTLRQTFNDFDNAFADYLKPDKSARKYEVIEDGKTPSNWSIDPSKKTVRIRDDDDYGKLPSGTRYIGPDNKERTKP